MKHIQQYFADLSETQVKQLAQLGEFYTEWNSKINVISRKDIEKGVRRVYGLTNFKKVIYHINKNHKSDTYTLTVKLDEKPPAELKASVHYDNLFSAGILLNLTVRNMLVKSSRTI